MAFPLKIYLCLWVNILLMRLFHHKKTLKKYLASVKAQGKSLGFVPTMGALHSGHLAIVKRAARENDAVVVSIFVNPTQFDNPEDLEKYPRTLEADTGKLSCTYPGVIVFAPAADEVYEKGIGPEKFYFGGLEDEMEGKYRKDHFNGVATVVKKLLEIVMPQRAYFGEKDYQQLLIVKALVKQGNFPVEVIGCPIEREPHGLAMSSRNERLPESTRNKAAFIYETLTAAKEKWKTESPEAVKAWVTHQFKNQPAFTLEYVEIADAETLQPLTTKRNNRKYRIFTAVYADTVRLIDNIALN